MEGHVQAQKIQVRARLRRQIPFWENQTKECSIEFAGEKMIISPPCPLRTGGLAAQLQKSTQITLNSRNKRKQLEFLTQSSAVPPAVWLQTGQLVSVGPSALIRELHRMTPARILAISRPSGVKSTWN